MATPKKNKKKLKQKLTDTYRLVIINENSFEERISLKLTRLRVFILGGFFSVVLIAITISLLVFTPLKEYIPGYLSTKLKKDAFITTLKVDSLQTKIAILERYFSVIQPVLTGDISPQASDSLMVEAKKRVIDESQLSASREDSIFREKIERKDRFPIRNTEGNNLEVVFFAPLSGTISQEFNPDIKHLAIDIVSKTGTPVKAVADGTVIFSGWTTETGYVIVLNHSNNFNSVYKHNGNLLKQQGEFVKSGEVIASVGSTGELSTGPHLHFELWSDGYAVNPSNYIDFK